MENNKKSKSNSKAGPVNAGNRSERVRRKTETIAANESSIAADLKNREHGNEQPGRKIRRSPLKTTD
jgi:hypothetical protein